MSLEHVWDEVSARFCTLRVPEGSRLPEALSRAAEACGARLAFLTGIGGLDYARLAVFDASRSVYRYVEVKPMEGHVLEVASLTGNVACFQGACHPHAHLVVARSPGEVYAGHLLEARVKPFLELLVIGLRAPEEVLERVFGARRRSIAAEPL